MCLEEELEKVFFFVGDDDDGKRNQPFHGWWANNPWDYHEFAPQRIGRLLFLWPFWHQPKPTSSTKPLFPSKLVCSRKYHNNNKKHKIPKTPPPPNKTQTPNKRYFTHTQLNNLKTTQQEKLHKHPTRDLKLTNTKSKSTKHPTTRKNPQITQHPTKRESTTTQQEIWSLRF